MARYVTIRAEDVHTVVVGSLAEYQAKVARSNAVKSQDRIPCHRHSSMHEMMGMGQASPMREILGV